MHSCLSSPAPFHYPSNALFLSPDAPLQPLNGYNDLSPSPTASFELFSICSVLINYANLPNLTLSWSNFVKNLSKPKPKPKPRPNPRGSGKAWAKG